MEYYYKIDCKYHHLQINKQTKKSQGISIAQKMHGHASTVELKNFL